MTTSAKPEQIWVESRRRLIPGTVIGSIIEWYDIAIYGQAAALVFGTLFFPSSPHRRPGRGVRHVRRRLLRPAARRDPLRPHRRPVRQALLAGGDAAADGGRDGRHRAAADLRRHRHLAPVLLVVFRLLQGLGVGAEYVGAVTMVAEFAPVKRRGFFASMPASGVFLGIGLAAAISAAVATLPADQLMSWGWRVPFLLSIIVVAIGLMIRLRVPESPVFKDLREARARTKGARLTMIRAMPKRFVLVMLANGGRAEHLRRADLLAELHRREGRSGKSGADRAPVRVRGGGGRHPALGASLRPVGRRPAYLVVTAICAMVPFPFFWLLDTHNTVLILLAFGLAFGGCLAMFGSQAAYYAELFPSAYRFSGFALGREIPGAVLGPRPRHLGRAGQPRRRDPDPAGGRDGRGGPRRLLAVVALPETRGVDLAPIVDPDRVLGTTPPGSRRRAAKPADRHHLTSLGAAARPAGGPSALQRRRFFFVQSATDRGVHA